MHKALLRITHKVLQEYPLLLQYHHSTLQIYGAESSGFPLCLTTYYHSRLEDTVLNVHFQFNQYIDQELPDKLIVEPLN